MKITLLRAGIGVDTNEIKDAEFCSKCGRELIPSATRDCYCPYSRNDKKRKTR
jgi:hypothetical protein